MNRCGCDPAVEVAKASVAKASVEKVSVAKPSYPTGCPECKSNTASKLCKCMLENGKACSDYRCATCKLRWHYCRETGENIEGEIVDNHVFCKRCDDELGVYRLGKAREEYEELLAKYGGSKEAAPKVADSKVDLDALIKLEKQVAEMHMVIVELSANLSGLMNGPAASRVGIEKSKTNRAAKPTKLAGDDLDDLADKAKDDLDDLADEARADVDEEDDLDGDMD